MRADNQLDQETPNNPAGRLLSVLEEADSIGKKNPTKLHVRVVWAKVFNIDVLETDRLFTGYLSIINLINSAKKIIEELDDIDPELHLAPFNRLMEGVSTVGFNHTWNQFGKYLDPATMTGLKHCSHMLSIRVAETVITKKELETLKTEIRELQEKVLNADLPQELYVLLHKKLGEMHLAIMEYRFTGVSGMQQALDSTLGGLLLAREQVENETKKDKSIVKEVMDFIHKYKGAVSNVIVKQVASGAMDLALEAIN